TAADEVWQGMARKSVCQPLGEPDRGVQFWSVTRDLCSKFPDLPPLGDDDKDLRGFVRQEMIDQLPKPQDLVRGGSVLGPRTIVPLPLDQRHRRVLELGIQDGRPRARQVHLSV